MSNEQVVMELKRGATLSLAGTVALPAGQWVASAQVRDTKGALLAALDVTLSEPVAPSQLYGIVIEGSSIETATFPVADVLCDVRFADTGQTPNVVIQSPSFVIRVVQEQTRAG